MSITNLSQGRKTKIKMVQVLEFKHKSNNCLNHFAGQ